MQFDITQSGMVSRVEMPEKITMANSDSTRDALTKIIDNGQQHLLLDLSNVTFVDSSGLAVFVAALKKAQPLGGQIVLLSPTKNVQALIELTRLHEVFDIYEDSNAAIEDMQTGD